MTAPDTSLTGASEGERIVVKIMPLGCNEQDLLPHDRAKAKTIASFGSVKAACDWINSQTNARDYFIAWEPVGASAQERETDKAFVERCEAEHDEYVAIKPEADNPEYRRLITLAARGAAVPDAGAEVTETAADRARHIVAQLIVERSAGPASINRAFAPAAPAQTEVKPCPCPVHDEETRRVSAENGACITCGRSFEEIDFKDEAACAAVPDAGAEVTYAGRIKAIEFALIEAFAEHEYLEPIEIARAALSAIPAAPAQTESEAYRAGMTRERERCVEIVSRHLAGIVSALGRHPSNFMYGSRAAAGAILSTIKGTAPDPHLDAEAASAVPSDPPGDGDRFQHFKTGGFYRLISKSAQVQTGTPLTDHAPVVVYAAERDGTVWVRPLIEWEDGRFIPAPGAKP